MTEVIAESVTFRSSCYCRSYLRETSIHVAQSSRRRCTCRCTRPDSDARPPHPSADMDTLGVLDGVCSWMDPRRCLQGPFVRSCYGENVLSRKDLTKRLSPVMGVSFTEPVLERMSTDSRLRQFPTCHCWSVPDTMTVRIPGCSILGLDCGYRFITRIWGTSLPRRPSSAVRHRIFAEPNWRSDQGWWKRLAILNHPRPWCSNTMRGYFLVLKKL